MLSWLETHWPEAELRLLAHRFLYYVRDEAILRDVDYDQVEREVLPFVPLNSLLRQPGSDRPSDYPFPVEQMADWLVKPTTTDDFNEIVMLYTHWAEGQN